MQEDSKKPPKPKKKHQLSGFWAARRALQRFGEHVIDGRSRLAHALDEFRDEIIRDLGGEEAVSRQQRVVIDLVVRTHLMVQSLDNYLLNLGSLVNRRKRALWPVVRERAQLADSLARYMSILGLEKRKPPEKDLRAYLAERSTAPAEEFADDCKEADDHEHDGPAVEVSE